MKPVYVMALAYSSLAEAQKDFVEIEKEIRSASKSDFKIALRTSQSMLLIFTSEVPQVDLQARMKGLAYRDTRYVLFEASGLLAGFLEPASLEWLMARIPREGSKTASPMPPRSR